MKKLFNYALLAAALLVGVNVNAETVSSYVDLKTAIESATEDLTIEVSTNLTGQDYIAIQNGQQITLELKNSAVIECTGKKNFVIEHGKLNITGAGTILNSSAASYNNYIFSLTGTSVDEPKHSELIIGEGIIARATQGYGIIVARTNLAGTALIPDALGVYVDIFGYLEGAVCGIHINGGYTNKTATNLPTFIVERGAFVKAAESNFQVDGYWMDPDAIYAAGYAIWNIKGTVSGCCGFYAKGGVITIDGGNIYGVGDYKPVEANNNGASGTGNALVIDTNKGYTGNAEVTIKGNAEIASNNGYGIQEIVTNGEETTTKKIEILSGEISGADDKGSIVTSESGEGVTDIEGGTFNSDITQYLGPDNIVTPVDNGDGTTSYVIGKKENEDAWVTSINAVTKKTDYVKLTGTEETLSKDVEAEYLVANTTAKVTIPEGKTLKVGEIVMSKDAQIIVEKNAKLIVKGTKGIVANQASNIILKSEEDAPAYFLLDPDVTSNKTPKATVTYTSGAYKIADGQFSFDFFGAPMGTVNKVTSSSTVYTSWFDVNDKGTSWTTIGSIKNGVADLDYSLFNRPFGFFQIQSFNPSTELITYTFEGNVFGNSSPEVACQAGWPGFSNAYTGDIDVDAFCDEVYDLGFDFAVYTYTQVGNNTLVWTANSPLKMKEEALSPMRAFMLRNTGAAKNLAMDYKAMVWDPAMEGPAGAPRMNNIKKATIRIDGANGIFDELTVAQDESFDANCKYNAEKYMNTDLNIYVKGEKNLAIAATDNLNNTFVGFNCKNAGKYTMSFEGVTGNFALVDTKTNARIEMSEGNTYEFLAEAGEDAYRFQIVEAAKAPTDMQKTNAAIKANKALVNGQIVISNGERFFNVLGTEVK